MSNDQFAEADSGDHFPLGPVVGGVVGGVGGLAIIGVLLKLCYSRYQRTGGKII